MNKARRHELMMLKYKKRLKLKGLPAECLKNPLVVVNGITYNVTGYRNSSKPCSCFFCRHEKYNRARTKREELVTV
ncbi:MAG: hypothetical protein EOO04_36540 [Chitinophagaceae bacterium]|nr:MAG: hypothetical protein EOO04_36540 [Chitinophagaceae bacterium]